MYVRVVVKRVANVASYVASIATLCCGEEQIIKRVRLKSARQEYHIAYHCCYEVPLSMFA